MNNGNKIILVIFFGTPALIGTYYGILSRSGMDQEQLKIWVIILTTITLFALYLRFLRKKI